MSAFFCGLSAVTWFGRLQALLSRVPLWFERALLLVVIWQLAGIFWGLCAPSTGGVGLTLPRPGAVRGTVSRDALLGWYGTDDRAKASVAGDYRLIAVIAGQHGAAVVKGSGGTSVAARVGEDLNPGTKLVSVEPTRITLEKGGVRQELKLPQSDAVSSPNILISRTSPTGSSRSAQLKPIRVTRGQMVAVMQGNNVAVWDKGLSTVPEGGIRIDQSAMQPLARLLQLKDGDLLKRVNQRPLNHIADISLISYYFGQYAAVDVDLVRNGAQFTQHYDIQP